MLEISAAGRAGTSDKVATVAAFLKGPDGAFITGSDFLMDGGVAAAGGLESSPRLSNDKRALVTWPGLPRPTCQKNYRAYSFLVQ